MCRPPAATDAILTPGLSATKQGSAERVSSPDELSAECLAGDTRLLLEVSSPPLLSLPDPDAPLDLDP